MTNIGRLEERVEDAIGILGDLLKESENRPPQGKRRFTLLADLILRAEQPLETDGYPRANLLQQRVSGSGSEESYSDPTPGAVVAREGDVCGSCVNGTVVLDNGSEAVCRRCRGTNRRWGDPVVDSVEEMEFRLRVVFRELQHVERCYRRITKIPKPILPSEVLVGHCLACGYLVAGVPNDRLKRGLDNKCYLSWTSWKLKKENQDSAGNSDFQRWLGWRQAWLKKDAEENSDEVDEEIDRLRASKTLPPPSQAMG